MEIRRSVRVPSSPEQLFPWVEDLAVYPQWMRLVHSVDAAPTEPGEPPAWNVELQARVGPLTRSKRLRMIRTVHEPPHEVVFERAEIDGRSHSPWVLRAMLTGEHGDEQGVPATALTMELHYGGNLWAGAVLQRVLDDEVRRGSDALIVVVSDEPTH